MSFINLADYLLKMSLSLHQALTVRIPDHQCTMVKIFNI